MCIFVVTADCDGYNNTHMFVSLSDGLPKVSQFDMCLQHSNLYAHMHVFFAFLMIDRIPVGLIESTVPI